MRAALGDLDGTFDLVIVGGGVHGAFASLEATRRGLRVALVEQGDFGGGTSGNSLRIAHGGLRYLGRGDLRRMRESVRERATLMHLAPHLLRPLPCALPLSRRALRPAYAAALRLNDVVAHRLGGDGMLPPSRTIGRETMRRLAEDAWWGASSVAALWHDALIDSPERLIIMILREAASRGARVRNYTRATSLLRDARGRVHGVSVSAREGSAELRARVVLDATGPGSAALVGAAPPCDWALGWNAVLARPAQNAAIAIPFHTERRALFAVPHRGCMVLGTGYVPVTGTDGNVATGPRHAGSAALHSRVLELLEAANRSRPDLALTERDVTMVHAGVLPMSRHGRGVAVPLLDSPLIVHHASHGSAAGVVSMIGVKWTTARAVAERAVLLCERLLRGHAGDARAMLPLAPLCTGAADANGVAGDALRALYGPLAYEVESIGAADPGLMRPLGSGRDAITGAQVVHAVRLEGAVRLEDVLLRRTTAAATGWPGDETVRAAARLMAAEAGWNEIRLAQEVGDMAGLFGRELQP